MKLRRVLTLLVISCAALTGGSARASTSFPVVDTLGPATHETTFSVFGAGGFSLTGSQFVGPEFSLSEPTLINEIGAFLNNCKSFVAGSPDCPGALPMTVQVRRSDTLSLVAVFSLSHDDDPLVVSYESVALNLLLDEGTYVALFAPQGGDEGFLLGGASDPFEYRAGLTTLGILNTAGGTFSTSLQFAAVRILGRLLPNSIEQCLNNRWRAFGVFKNEGDCVSYVATDGKNAPN